MAATSRVRCELFDSLCRAAAAKLQAINAQDLANTPWAMAKTSRVLPEGFDSLSQESSQQSGHVVVWKHVA